MDLPVLSRYRLIVFDLDGTLVDTSQGVFGSVRYAEHCLGLSPLPDEMLALFVGPPPCEAYEKFHGLNANEARIAAEMHRSYSREHAVKESLPYQGVDEMLRKLRQRGFVLGVATLKNQTIAHKVLSFHGLESCFDVVVGMDEAETMTKARAIALCRDKTGEFGRAALVGDTPHDEKGAREAGVDFIAALWGYGFGHAALAEPVSNAFGVCTPDELAFC